MAAPLRACILALLAILLSACQLRVGVDVDVQRDGGGELAVTVGGDEELLGQARAAGADPLVALAEQGRRLEADGWRVTTTPQEVRLAAGFASPEEFNALAADLAEALAAPEVRLLEPLTLAVDGRRITLRGGAGLQPTDAVTELGVMPEEVIRLAAQDQAVVYTVRARMPGELVETTANRRDRDLLVWDVPPGERVEVLAVGTRPPRVLLAAGAALLVAVAVALTVVVVRRRRARTAG